MVYISHRLREVLEITDRVVCLRDGERVAELPTREATLDKLVELLAGTTNVTEAAPPAARPEVVLSVRGRVSFDLHAGEILGLAGLVGAGRSSVLRELFGVAPLRPGGDGRWQAAVDPEPARRDGGRVRAGARGARPRRG